jgi:hypothetical protein
MMASWASPRAGCRSYQSTIQMGAKTSAVQPTIHNQMRSSQKRQAGTA